MPLYLDTHTMTGGVTAGDVAKAHMADLQTQGKYNVRYLQYWVDEQRAKCSAWSGALCGCGLGRAPRGPRPGRRRHLPGPGGLLMHPWRCDRSANWPAAPGLAPGHAPGSRGIDGPEEPDDAAGGFVMTQHNQQPGPSRRHLLAGAGAGLAAVSAGVLPGMSAAARAAAPPGPRGQPGVPGAPGNEGLFGDLPGLPPFAEATDQVRAALLNVGMPGGTWTPLMTSPPPEEPHRRPDRQRQPDRREPVRHQPGQPDDDRRVHVRRAVHRPRHNVRPNVPARHPAEPADLSQHPDPRAGSRLRVRRRPGQAADLYVPNPDGSAGPQLKIGTGGVHEDMPGWPTETAPSRLCSAIRATTRT